MPVRIEIELTSSAPDGSWTWRAAGARAPRGVLDGSILPSGSAVGDQLRVETEHDIEGIRVLSVVPSKEKGTRAGLLELLPSEERFEPVVQHRAPGGRDDGPRRPRRDRDDRGDRGDRAGRGDRGDRAGRGDRDRRAGDGRSDRDRTERGERREGGDRRPEGDDRRRPRPHFTPPPEVPQRPKPKRLRPGKRHRTDVLAATPEEQRPVAELTLQGMAAVRQRLREDNARLKAEGKPEMPEAAVMKMAEEMLPRLRAADWLDRAEAAQRQLEHLDLRDLRSVVASADDPLVARDETTRELAAELKVALVTKQEEELTLWLADVEAALDVGRVVRALRLSSQPPKAGVPFPGALAARLAEAASASLQPTDGPDRWSAVLEAAAFSPVRTQVAPTAAPEVRPDELLATVKRLGPLLPQVAALFGVEVAANAPTPKPLRPNPRRDAPKKAAPRPPQGASRGPRLTPTATARTAAAPAEEQPADASPADASPAGASPAEESPADASPAGASPAEQPPAEESTAEPPATLEAPDMAPPMEDPTPGSPADAAPAAAAHPPARDAPPAAVAPSAHEAAPSAEQTAEAGPAADDFPPRAEQTAVEGPSESPAAGEPGATEEALPAGARPEPAAESATVGEQPVDAPTEPHVPTD